MELSEAFDTIDATLGMFNSFADEIKYGELKEDFLLTHVQSSIENVYDMAKNEFVLDRKQYYTYVDCDTEYKKYIVDIRPVCNFMVNEWPSAKAKNIRRLLDEVFLQCIDLCSDTLGLDINVALEEGYKYDRLYNTGRHNNCTIEDVMLDTIHEMCHALGLTEYAESDVQHESPPKHEDEEITKEVADGKDWVKLTEGFNLDKIREVVRKTGKTKSEKKIVIKAIFDALMSVDKLYNVPYDVDKLILQLYKEAGGQVHDLHPTKSKKGSFFAKPKIPAELAESKYWKKLKEAGWVDEDGQPTCSRTEAAILADELLEKIKKGHKWTIFEKMWNRKNMRTDFQEAMKLVKYDKVRKKIVKILG